MVQAAISEKVGAFLHHVSTFFVGFAIAFWRGWSMTLVRRPAFVLRDCEKHTVQLFPFVASCCMATAAFSFVPVQGLRRASLHVGCTTTELAPHEFCVIVSK